MSLMWVDSIVINHRLGTAAFAAVQLAGQVINMVGLVLMIVAAGLSVVIAYQVGAGQRLEAGQTAAQSIGLGVLLSVALGGILSAAAPVLLHLLGAVGEVQRQGLTFMRIAAAAMPAQAMLTLLPAILRATGNTRSPMVVTLLVNLLNAGLNLVLVVGTPALRAGALHIPAVGGGLGLLGSATGTAVAQATGALLLLYLLLCRSGLLARPYHFFRFEAATVGRVARIGLPAALEFMSYQGSQFVLSMIVGPLGTAVIAARGLTFQAETFVYLPSVGMREAASITVGQLMGAGQREQAVTAGRRAITYSMAGIAALAAVLFLCSRPIAGIFTADPVVLGYAAGALQIAALYKVGQVVNIVCNGIYTGAGNPQWPTTLTTLSAWCLTVPLAFLAVRHGYGLTGIFWAMFLDEMTRGAINLWYFTTPRWRFRQV